MVDPGFPHGGGVNPQGAPAYNFAKFSPELDEIERIWIPRGTCVAHTPLRSTNAITGQNPKATTKVTLTSHPVVI